MALELVKPDHPILKQSLEEFDFKSPPTDPVDLANSLIDTMKIHRGLGLSASQCGLPYRVFVLWSEKPFVCFNPRIIDKTSETTLLEEGCLSFPHLIVKVKRPTSIKVRFQDAFGEMHTEKFTGMTARAFQHELDHMDGITFHARANKIHLDRALNQQKILMRQLKRGEVTIRPTEISTTEQDLKNAQLSIMTTDRVVDLASGVKL